MPRFEVAIATRNPRILYRAVELLKRMKLHFTVCAPEEPDCQAARVVMTSIDDEVGPEDANRIITLNEDFDEEIAAIEIMMRLSGIVNVWTGVIGIDPGMRYGLALLINGYTIHTDMEATPARAVRHTKRWLSYLKGRHESCTLIVRVGIGSRLYSALYLRRLMAEISSEVSIELVDEYHTTMRFRDHRSSATLIGARQGRKMTKKDAMIDLKEGYVKSLRQLVRRITEGAMRLSKAEARLILQGETSIEAILEHNQSEKKASNC